MFISPFPHISNLTNINKNGKQTRRIPSPYFLTIEKRLQFNIFSEKFRHF